MVCDGCLRVFLLLTLSFYVCLHICRWMRRMKTHYFSFSLRRVSTPLHTFYQNFFFIFSFIIVIMLLKNAVKKLIFFVASIKKLFHGTHKWEKRLYAFFMYFIFIFLAFKALFLLFCLAILIMYVYIFIFYLFFFSSCSMSRFHI